MPTSLVIVADTHVPKRAKDLHASLWADIAAADLVIHAGDWVDSTLLDEFESRSKNLVGVYGNNDHGTLRERLPEEAHVEVDGIQIAVVHETGPAAGREQRCEARFGTADVLVFGHSHIPWDSLTPRGLRLLNPGSPTDRRRQPMCTYLTALVDHGTLRDVTLVPLPLR